MQSHYHTSIDPKSDNNSHSAMLRLVGFNKRVLEAGCASGHVSEMLHAQGCRVVGIELDEAVVAPARQWVEQIIVGDFDDESLWRDLDGEFFDVLLFGDVLEHLKDPLETLRNAVKHLDPSGIVVISVPNISHADVKIALVQGRFPYADSGLLDRTHIHFFTKESLLELVREAGLLPVDVTRITLPAFATELGVHRGDVDEHVLAALLEDREAETYQFVIKAVRDNGTQAIENLSQSVVTLTDQLRDEQRHRVTLESTNEKLQLSVASLEAQHEIDVDEVTNLRLERDAQRRFIRRRVRRLLRGTPESR